jgi:hypothetical protein
MGDSVDEDLLALARLDERRDIIVADGPASDRPRRRLDARAASARPRGHPHRRPSAAVTPPRRP